MLDAVARPLVDAVLDPAGRWLAHRGIAADYVTIAGFVLGLAAAAAIALGHPMIGLGLIACNRVADGFDGAIARATGPTERGAFLDIALDFVFYAAIPLAFAVHDPDRNALAAACLLGSFVANGCAFLAFATIAAKRGLTTSAQGAKSIYYLAGLAEGTETIAAFTAFCLWPSIFAWGAYGFAAICCVSALARIAIGWKTLV